MDCFLLIPLRYCKVSREEERLMSGSIVTVLIPAYNAELTLDRALRSVWRQHWPDLEVVIVDDASSDRTAEVARRHARPELRLVRLERNRGECGAMNAGLEVARGEFVAFLDADDEWLDEKLARQIPVVSADSELSFVACRSEFTWSDGRTEIFGGGPEISGVNAWRALLHRSQTGKPCVVARRSKLLKVGGFDERLKVAGDQDMWIRLALAGPAVFLPDVLVRVHVTPNSLMQRYAKREIEFTLPMIERRLAAIGDRLSDAERRQIRAERLTQIGRNCYDNGCLADGAKLLARAIWLGDERSTNLWYLFTAAPPIRSIKRFLGIGAEARVRGPVSQQAQI